MFKKKKVLTELEQTQAKVEFFNEVSHSYTADIHATINELKVANTYIIAKRADVVELIEKYMNEIVEMDNLLIKNNKLIDKLIEAFEGETDENI